MDKRPRKELIDSMREKLRNFEEPYDRSEWEYFKQHRNKKHKKPVPLFVKLAGIAAALVVVVYASVQVLPLFDRSDVAGKHILKDRQPTQPHMGNEQADSQSVDSVIKPVNEETPESITIVTVHAEVARDRKQILLDEMRSTAVQPHTITFDDVEATAPSDRILTNPRSAGAGIIHRKMKRSPLGPRRSLQIDLAGIAGWVGSWPDVSGVDVGGNITPLFTNKGFSIGGGVSARLPLSNRLKAEIGVSYLNLKVGQDNKVNPADTITSQLASVRHSVGMVALPLSLNYAISENVSASLGLTPFRVIRDQRTEILQRNKWVTNDFSPGDSTRGRMVTERTRLQRPDSVYMGNSYLGFVKLSAQYNPPILRRRNLVLEPFVAMPVGKLREDEHRWLNGGVSIRFYLHRK